MATQPRIGSISRVTSESDIRVEIKLDGTGTVEIDTGVPFFDHMLTAFGVHGAFDLKVKATGDTHIDAHHTVEDTAIVLGQAIAQAVGDKRGIKRFGSFQLPMDETLCEAIVDFSGRPYFVTKGEPDYLVHSVIGSHYPTVLNEHFFESLALNAKITLHVLCRYGRDPHHITEAEFKAVARAIREAVGPDDRLTGIPSTKGAL